MLQQYVNLRFLTHLNQYDLIQKFNSQTSYVSPKINKLTLKIFLKGSLNENFLKLYVKNFLLLYFFCFNLASTKLKFKKIRRRKQKDYKVKLLVSYTVLKKKILSYTYNLFFYFKKFLRPFYFSNKNMTFSYKSGKCKFLTSKVITFLPGLVILDHKERRFFPYLNKSKVFLTFTVQQNLGLKAYNYFNSLQHTSKQFLKNFLLLWHLL